jgi:hypothetical protein
MERRSLHEMGFGSHAALLRLPEIRHFFAVPPHVTLIPPIATSSVIHALIEYSRRMKGRVTTSKVWISGLLVYAN